MKSSLPKKSFFRWESGGDESLKIVFSLKITCFGRCCYSRGHFLSFLNLQKFTNFCASVYCNFYFFYTFKNHIFYNFPISPLQDVIKIDQKYETNKKYFVQTQDLPLTTATVLPKLYTVSTATIPLGKAFSTLTLD